MQSLTVKELIEQLSDCDENTKVIAETDGLSGISHVYKRNPGKIFEQEAVISINY